MGSRSLTCACSKGRDGGGASPNPSLPAAKPTPKYPSRGDGKGGRVRPFPLRPPPPCSHQRRFAGPWGATHHTARRVQLAVRDAAEVLAAASVVSGAVTDGAKGVKEDLQAVEGGGGHQLFPARRKRRKCFAASMRHCECTRNHGCCVGFSGAQVSLGLTVS